MHFKCRFEVNTSLLRTVSFLYRISQLIKPYKPFRATSKTRERGKAEYLQQINVRIYISKVLLFYYQKELLVTSFSEDVTRQHMIKNSILPQNDFFNSEESLSCLFFVDSLTCSKIDIQSFKIYFQFVKNFKACK